MALSHPPLRVILAAAFGGIALLAALATSLLAGDAAARRVEANQLAMLDSLASRFAERLDRDMAARWRDVRVTSRLPLMRDPATPPEIRRDILRQMHETFADYALLAFVGPDGRVVADSLQLLEGQDASGRPFVRAGMQGPVVEDVHDALMLAGKLGNGGQLRLLDLAAPVRAADGSLVGVVAAHLNWRWAAELVGTPRAGEPEILILSRTGEVLLGPPGLLGRPLPAGIAGRGEAEFPGEGRFLLSRQPTQGFQDYPGMGWEVLARRPLDLAMAPAQALRRDILLYGLGASACAALLGWLAAAWLVRPLHRLAEAAARQQREGGRDPLPPGTGYAEAVLLARAFDGLLSDCRRGEAALAESEQRLRLAQRAGQIGAYEWDIPADTGRATREYAVLHGLPAPETDTTWGGRYGHWLARLHPEDRPRLRERIRRILAEAGPYALEYRILLPDGRTRWLHDRGEVFADAAGRPVRALGAVRDVTARRAAEDALREGEARLRLAQEAGGIGSWDLDLATGKQVWSERQYTLFGLDPALPPPDMATWFALVHPADRPALSAARDAALAGADRPLAAEFRIRRASDGAERWLAATGRVMRDEAGRPVRMLGVNRDVTEARAREAELRAMLEANPLGVLRGDVHGRILDANDALLRLAGRSRAELEAGTLRWDSMTPPEWLPMDAAGIAEAREKGACTPYEKEYWRPDGSRVPILVGFALVGPAREETIAFILDLTDRKRAEVTLLADKAALERAVAERTAELAAREHELRRIYDRTPAAFHSVDATGKLIRVSEQWLAFLGYRREEVLGRRTGEFMLPESAARWEAALAELRETGDEVREVEYRMRRADGEVLDVLVRARAEHDAEGRFLHSFSVLLDLTERNRAEARLREAQKLEGLGRIAGGVAHDFNNLLQVLTGALQMLRSHAGDRTRVERYAGIALEAAERGAGLTRRMLAFARQDQLQAGPVPLPEVMQGLATLLHGALGAGIRLEIDAPESLPPVQADRAQLDLVLFSLALNARDAMPQGGRLRIEAAMEAVGEDDRQGLAPGPYLRIRVADTGQGMDAPTLARATEPFFTTKEVGRGSGLGLAMAHGFARQSGGDLLIESAPGRGTVVTLRLPRAEALVPLEVAAEG
ncbi:PAS domain-containing protein [Paracraurococcus lichenis]|uniref:histidine kinase n=1 Tax=Paracraurococcus lichenis TaxID=3064888 RepID=A0ABT9DYL7_9PROT|nr:PAS domain-containing protein [Paracraurococcus sp. LOR1-02]MDO9709001.1 PAS domain-containing protein [Paracraurococcus sp. LOR1-02]